MIAPFHFYAERIAWLYSGLTVDRSYLRDHRDTLVRLGHDSLAVGALEGIEEAVARCVGDELARLPADRGVEQDVGARLVVVPHVARYVLVIPVHLAAVGIPGDQAVGVEIVAGAVVGVGPRHWVAGAPQQLVCAGIVGARHPHGAAAGLPGVILVLPRLAARLARRGNDEVLRHQ